MLWDKTIEKLDMQKLPTFIEIPKIQSVGYKTLKMHVKQMQLPTIEKYK